MKVLILILLLILIFFHTRGVITHDEGYLLQSSLRFLHGDIPYKDFHFVYTPGSIFLTTLSFFLFSPSILSSRILMIVVSLVASILIYKTTLLSTKNKLYALLSVLVYVSWGPSHVNFSWPVMFCIPIGVLLLYLLLKFSETTQERYLYLSGITTFLLFLFKQNFGVAGIIASLIYFLTVRKARKATFLLSYTYGLIWSALLFCVYLFITDSFAQFTSDMYDFTFMRIFLPHDLCTPFFYNDTLIKTAGRILLYVSPLGISLATIVILILRQKYTLLFVPIFVLCFYVLEIRPTTDYIHLVPLLSLSGIPSVMFLRFNISSTAKILIHIGILLFILLGFYTSLFKGYYRWDEPLLQHNIFYGHPRVNVFVNTKAHNDFSEFLSIVGTHSEKDEYIFVNTYNPLFYFISDRKEPTSHNYLTHDVNMWLYKYEVILALSRNNIPLIISPKNSTQEFDSYIKNHYILFDSFGDYDVYKQK